MTFSAWAVFLLLTAYTIWDGVRRSIGAKDMEGFFAAGRSIPWWASGLSVMATQLSAITIISGVGMGYENGLEWIQFYFALPFAMVLLCVFFVPMYRRNPILTAYELLERRFGPVTRMATSATFLLSRCLAFGVVLYAPSVVFSVMTGLPINETVIAVGVLTTAYTIAGGVGGVVWTDVKQMLIIVVGIAVSFAVVLWRVLQEVPASSLLPVLGAAGRLNAVEVVNPSWTLVAQAGETGGFAPGSFWSDKYNLWTGLFGTLFLFLSYFGCDQVQVQSLLTSKSADGSRRALLLSAFTKVPLQLFVLLLGGVLFLATSLRQEQLLFDPSHASRPLSAEQQTRLEVIRREHAAACDERRVRMLEMSRLPDGLATRPDLVQGYQEAVRRTTAARKAARTLVHADEIQRAKADGRDFPVPGDSNYVFPHFIFNELPKPLLGLMLAAIFAAAISSAAGALSSLTSATMVDFYRRVFARGLDERRSLLHSRIVMAGWGAVATVAAIWLGQGPLLERVNEVGSWFYGSILGVFLLALAVPRAGGVAATAGLLGGLASVLLVHNTMSIAFLWYNLVGCAGAMAVGIVVATFTPRRPQRPAV